MLQQGKPWHKYAREVLEVTHMYALTKAFHWTPEQIRNISEYDKSCYLSLIQGESMAQEDKK